MPNQPLVSIVTVCLNAEQFIEKTIESVLVQDYPHIEYIIMDGGSTDGTLALLESYQGRIQYFSAADDGAADAINRGFLKTHGSIFAWLNADDTYLPGAVTTAVRALLAAPKAAMVYGEGVWIDHHDGVLGRYPTVLPYAASSLERECCFCQPTCFIRREAFQRVGKLNPNLHSAFDYDLWIRLSALGPFIGIPELLATSRMHRSNKTLGQRRRMFEECMALLDKHYGYVPVNWIYGYWSYRKDGRDQYFEPLCISVPVYLFSLFAGSCYNYRHLWRYWREWASKLSVSNLRSLVNRVLRRTL